MDNLSDLPRKLAGKNRFQMINAIKSEAQIIQHKENTSGASRSESRYLRQLGKIIEFLDQGRKQPTSTNDTELVSVCQKLNKILAE